jgi:cytochrome c biogenesis protein CcdA
MKNAKIKKNPKSSVSNLRKFIVGISVVILSCILFISICHVIQVHNLKQAASSIRVGDSRANVVMLLGNPKVTYTSGFPSGGGAATVWGSCYGGSLDSLMAAIDGSVYRICNGSPQWYHGFQNKEDWPVVIEFDSNDIVIAVNTQ